MIAEFDRIEAVSCPCGLSRRAFVNEDNHTATMHIVDISREAKLHYHKKLTEIYLVLEGGGRMELDGEIIPVKPMTAVLIRPGCRHRAVGRMRIVNTWMRIVNTCIPAFDPADEWFD